MTTRGVVGSADEVGAQGRRAPDGLGPLAPGGWHVPLRGMTMGIAEAWTSGSSASSRTRSFAGERLTCDDGSRALRESTTWPGSAGSPTTCAPEATATRCFFNVNRHLNLTNVCTASLRVLLVPAQAGREGRVHDAHRGGRRAWPRRWRASSSPSCTSSTACTRRCRGATTRASLRELKAALPERLAQGVHRHRDPLVREDLRPARRRDPRRADRRRPGVADRRRRGDLRLGGPPAHRRPRHPLGGLVAHPPARAQQGPARPRRPCSTGTSRSPGTGSTTCCGCASCRTRPAASQVFIPLRYQHDFVDSKDGKVRNRLQARTTMARRRRGAEDLRGLPAAVRQRRRT